MKDFVAKPGEVLFDGFTDDEILALPVEQMDAFVLNDKPQVFRIGSATVLGEFRRANGTLVIELAQIEGGGEGILTALGSLIQRYARLHQIQSVEWIVHAVHCARPNLKLRRVLDRRGFVMRDHPGIGEAYYFLDSKHQELQGL